MKIIKTFEKNESKIKSGSEFHFDESELRRVLSKADEYQDLGQSFSMQCERSRTPIIIEIKDLLTVTVKDCNQKSIPIAINNITIKI